MSREYVIVTDSACDLNADMAEELGLTVIPLVLNCKGNQYKNYLDGREIDIKEVYQMMREDVDMSTSAVNINDGIEAMEPILKEGKDILCISFSSGLSNTYNATALAAKELSEQYPDNKIYVIDSLCASAGEGLIVYLAAKEKEKGKTIEEVRDFVEDNKMKVCHWVSVDNLHQLKKGGRISATTEIVGSVLKIKPVIHVDNEGKLVSVAKARGRKMALKTLLDKIEESAIDIQDQTIMISHSDCLEEAEQLAEDIKARYGVKEVVISYIGIVIGAHTGPGTIALFFLGNNR